MPTTAGKVTLMTETQDSNTTPAPEDAAVSESAPAPETSEVEAVEPASEVPAPAEETADEVEETADEVEEIDPNQDPNWTPGETLITSARI